MKKEQTNLQKESLKLETETKGLQAKASSSNNPLLEDKISRSLKPFTAQEQQLNQKINDHSTRSSQLQRESELLQEKRAKLESFLHDQVGKKQEIQKE